MFRALPVVALPGYSRPMIRAEQYLELVEQHTYRDDRVRPLLMPSVWIERRETKRRRQALPRRVPARRPRGDDRYGGSFLRSARRTIRARGSPASWPRCASPISGVAPSRPLRHTRAKPPSGGELRVDVTEGTAVGTASQLARSCRCSASDASTRSHRPTSPSSSQRSTRRRKRETIRKSLTALAQVLDFAGVKRNPARDRVHVRLPREERKSRRRPTADQIDAVLPSCHAATRSPCSSSTRRACGVGELEEKGLRCGDLDEPNTRWRIRRAVEKGRRGRWVSLPPDLFAAVLATLPPREDRVPDRPVFPGVDPGAAADGDRASLQSVGNADVVAARPPPPAHQPVASAR